jgi:hypothetical protein
VTSSPGSLQFSQLFDRVALACARAQLLAAKSREMSARARKTRVTALQTRTLARDMRDAWAVSDRVFTSMRGQVEQAAVHMRAAGMNERAAAAAMRAHLRFILYDGGLCEAEVEPVVHRAGDWLAAWFEAA